MYLLFYDLCMLFIICYFMLLLNYFVSLFPMLFIDEIYYKQTKKEMDYKFNYMKPYNKSINF